MNEMRDTLAPHVYCRVMEYGLVRLTLHADRLLQTFPNKHELRLQERLYMIKLTECFTDREVALGNDVARDSPRMPSNYVARDVCGMHNHQRPAESTT